MSHLASKGTIKTIVPYIRNNSTTPTTTSTLALTGKTVQFVGDIYLQDPLGGSKTISAAGGGSIIWKAGTSVFADGSSVFTVGLQDLSTSSSPGQGDGTFDVKAVFTGSGITTAAVNTSVMTTGSKTISHGDQVAIVLEFTTRAGSDSVVVTYAGNGYEVTSSIMGNCVIDNVAGSYTLQSAIPSAIIKFDDGTTGFIAISNFIANASSTAYNSTTGTADEYGNLIKVPATFYAMGLTCLAVFSSGSSDAELILYSAPLTSTPVAEKTITIDGTQLGGTGANRSVTRLFATPFIMKANTEYVVSLRPTTANNVSVYYEDGITDSMYLQPPNDIAYAVRRLDNTGAFADTNGGTAKTRLYRCAVIGFYIEQGVNNATFQIGS